VFSILHVSFFDWSKNETQKSHTKPALARFAPVARLSALRLALLLRRGTNRNSRDELAQTAIRSCSRLGFALQTTNRATSG